MTFDPEPPSLGRAPMSRRGLLRTGGLTISFGALAAACGSDEGAPGRVGIAPVPTDLPSAEIDDAVLLRTATSLEHTALDVYARILELDVLDDAATTLIERLVEEHTRLAAATVEMTTQAGGEPYECPNPWLAERVVDPLFERLTGNDAEEIEPSDDPTRDALGLSYALESMVGASYQQLVQRLTTPELRQEAITYGAETVRHAAAVAILRDGAPAAYVSPTLSGGTVDLEATEGVIPLYAVTNQFGSLAPVELTLGPLSDAGTRFTTNLQTPADNAFVYTGQSCSA